MAAGSCPEDMLQSILLQMPLNSGWFSAHARRIQPAEIYFICWDIHMHTCNCHSNSRQRYFSFCKALPFTAFLPATPATRTSVKMEHSAAEMICYTQTDGPNSLEMMNKEVTTNTENVHLWPWTAALCATAQLYSFNSCSVAVSLMIAMVSFYWREESNRLLFVCLFL